MVTKNAIRNSRLGNLFLKKGVPGTSKHWPYHSDLIVVCLKFRLSPVCESLNYYYVITNDYWAMQEKIATGGVEDVLFRNKTRNF